MIILKRKFVDVELPSGVGMSGEYKLVVSDALGNVRRETDWFPNLILDQGLNRLGTDGAIAGCAIGTGSVAPAANQTGLQTQSAFTTVAAPGGAISTAGATPFWTGYTYAYRFEIGSLNGNYSEIGVGWATGANMFSRALILDSGGNPTTITVGAAEQLDVYYTRRLFPPLTDTTTTPTIGGVSTTVTTRATLAGNGTQTWAAFQGPSGTTAIVGNWPAYNGGLGAVTGSPSGSQSACTAISTATYANNSLSRTGSATFGTDAGNVAGGISAWICNMGMAAFQYGFSPAIAKDATKTLVLTISVSWARRP